MDSKYRVTPPSKTVTSPGGLVGQVEKPRVYDWGARRKRYEQSGGYGGVFGGLGPKPVFTKPSTVAPDNYWKGAQQPEPQQRQLAGSGKAGATQGETPQGGKAAAKQGAAPQVPGQQEGAWNAIGAQAGAGGGGTAGTWQDMHNESGGTGFENSRAYQKLTGGQTVPGDQSAAQNGGKAGATQGETPSGKAGATQPQAPQEPAVQKINDGMRTVNRGRVYNPQDLSETGGRTSSYTSRPQGGHEGSQGGGDFIAGSSTGVNVADPNFGSMKKYQDEAYSHAMRSLQPQMDQQSRRFEQTLVNKGIDPNSPAGKMELEKFQRGQNDMRQSAMFNAMQFGQQAQNQAYNQGLGASQLANAMARARMSDATSRYGMDMQNDQYYAGLGEQGRQFDLGQQMGYTGMLGNLMSQYLGADQGTWGMNNAADLQQYNARQGVMGAIPGWNPAMIDVNGSAGAATNSQQAHFNAAMQQSAQPWQTVAALGGAASGFFNPVP